MNGSHLFEGNSDSSEDDDEGDDEEEAPTQEEGESGDNDKPQNHVEEDNGDWNNVRVKSIIDTKSTEDDITPREVTLTNARSEILLKCNPHQCKSKSNNNSAGGNEIDIIRKNPTATTTPFSQNLIVWIKNNVVQESGTNYFDQLLEVTRYWISDQKENIQINHTIYLNENIYHQCVRAVLWGEVVINNYTNDGSQTCSGPNILCHFDIIFKKGRNPLNVSSQTRDIDTIPFHSGQQFSQLEWMHDLPRHFFLWFTDNIIGKTVCEAARANVSAALFSPYFKKKEQKIPASLFRRSNKKVQIDLSKLIKQFETYVEQVFNDADKAYHISNPMGVLGMVELIKYNINNGKYRPSKMNQKTKAKLLEKLVLMALQFFCIGQPRDITHKYTGFLHCIQCATIVMRYMCPPEKDLDLTTTLSTKITDDVHLLHQQYLKVLPYYTQFYKGKHAPISVSLIAMIAGLRLVVHKLMASKYIGLPPGNQDYRPRFNLTLHHFMQTSSLFDPINFQKVAHIPEPNDTLYVAVMTWAQRELVGYMNKDVWEKFNHLVFTEWGQIELTPQSIPLPDSQQISFPANEAILRQRGYCPGDLAWGFLLNNDLQVHLENCYPIPNQFRDDQRISFESIFFDKADNACFPYAVMVDRNSLFTKVENENRMSDPSTWKVHRWLWRKLSGRTVGSNGFTEIDDLLLMPIFPFCCYEAERGGNPVFMLGGSNTGKSTIVCFNAFFANAFLPKRYHNHLIYNKVKNDPMILDFGEVAGLDFVMPPQEIIAKDIDLNPDSLKNLVIYIDDVSGDKAISSETQSVIKNFVSNMSESKLSLIVALQTLTGTQALTGFKNAMTTNSNSIIILTGSYKTNKDVSETFESTFEVSRNHVGQILIKENQKKILDKIKLSQEWIKTPKSETKWWIGITSSYVCSSLPLFGSQAPGEYFMTLIN